MAGQEGNVAPRPPHSQPLPLDLVGDIYNELRRLAAFYLSKEPPGQTIQATSLVHEAYIRLSRAPGTTWESPRHFFNAAALAMRRILMDRAASKKAHKHGGGHARSDMDLFEIPAAREFAADEWESVERALFEIESHNTRWAEILSFRFLLGLTIEQTATALGISSSTVKSECSFARAWLVVKIRPAGSNLPHSQRDGPGGTRG